MVKKNIYEMFNLKSGWSYALRKMSLRRSSNAMSEVMTFARLELYLTFSVQIQESSNSIQIHRKLADCVSERFSNGIRPPPYILENHMADWVMQHPIDLLLLSTRFGGVERGLVNPKRTSACISVTGLTRRCSLVFSSSIGEGHTLNQPKTTRTCGTLNPSSKRNIPSW
jgi:hypothetical protein